ncbi:hypothetical protein KQX54_002937 [Cotesia glomerata]|uniref:Uncharacterized protein n=1 Tax=Cotesia glomerata TaxID=32391 RepID=A0AAV7IHM6_COTGL|nr:hypothetical protein KQX54_002937 [Cotesia glomerata]
MNKLREGVRGNLSLSRNPDESSAYVVKYSKQVRLLRYMESVNSEHEPAMMDHNQIGDNQQHQNIFNHDLQNVAVLAPMQNSAQAREVRMTSEAKEVSSTLPDLRQINLDNILSNSESKSTTPHNIVNYDQFNTSAANQHRPIQISHSEQYFQPFPPEIT